MTKRWWRRLRCYGLLLLVFFWAGGFVHDVSLGRYASEMYASALFYLALFFISLYPLTCMIVRE